MAPVKLSVSILAALCLLPSLATAHGIHVTATVDGHMIRGAAFYHGDTPVRGATVRALDPLDEEIGRTATDEQGRFQLEATSRCDHRLLVDTGDGHGGEFLVTASQLSEDLPSRDGPPTTAAKADLETIRRRLDELSSQLQTYEQTVRWRDVLGGIGFIFGMAGVAFYFLGVLRLQKRGR